MSAVDVLPLLSAPMREVLDLQRAHSEGAFATDTGFERMRAEYAREREYWNEGGPRMARTTDAVVPGPEGDIRIRAHHPALAGDRQGPDRPCLVYVHGGGFVVGGLDTHDRIMRVLAEDTGAVVVGVDYALSPEARFPRAVRECAAVATHLAEHSGRYGIDAGHLSFAGDSGGANLCLAATLYLRDEVPEAPRIRSLLLYYGMFGLRDSASRRLYGGEWDGLSRADLDYYRDCYTSGPADWDSPYYDCLGADLSGLPPVYLAPVALDPLLDDSLALAGRLTALGVPHRLRVHEGVLHGFLHYARLLPEAATALADGAAFYRSLLPEPTG